jgi:hypothetical protein
MLSAPIRGRFKNHRFQKRSALSHLFSIAYNADADWLVSSFFFCPLLLVSSLILSLGRPAQTQEPVRSPFPVDQTNQPASGLFRRVLENQKRNDQEMDQFEHIERTEFRKVGNSATPADVKVNRVFPAGTGMDKLPLSPDAKPANAQSYIAELEKLEKALVWAAQRGPAQQEAYAKLERKRKERHDLLDATHDAFLFTRVGEEFRGDRKLVKFTLMPNPSYKPTTRNTMIFPKVQGQVWIDEASSELARIEGYVTEDISIALFVAKIYKGSHFMQERYEFEPGLWLPSFQQYDFDGRRFFLSIAIHERTFFSNYKRVGPPSEAVAAVRAELSKLKGSPADP